MNGTATPGPEPESIDELAEDAKEDNPDSTTRRETFELDLMEEGRSKEGAGVELDDEDAAGG